MRGERAWTREEIEEQYLRATPLIRGLQQLLAASPGAELTADEAASTLNVERRQLAGAVGAYSNGIYRRFGRYEWPFAVRREYHARRATFYSMTPSVAEVIRSLAE